jgi:hypothetical protein
MSIRGIIDTWGHNVTIQTVTDTVDAGGSPLRTFANSQRDVRCLIVSKGTPETVVGGRPVNQMSATGYFPPTISIESNDRVIWVDGSTTRTFEVVAKREPLGLKSPNHLARKIVDLEQVE